MALDLHPRAQACGKIILLGEHAVVYGYPALAAGLPDSLTLDARPKTERHAPIELSIPSWGLGLQLSPDDDHPVARAALEVLTLCDGPVTGWSIQGTTRLPARAGLGSSAALTVALARLALGPDAPLEQVIEASLAGERVFHGQPSGIDSQVAARGGLLRFVRGESPEPVSLGTELPLVVVPSGIPRSTADQIAKVRTRHDALPRLARPVLETLGVAVGAALDAISSRDFARLGTILSMAHELLSALDVSSPALDALCASALESGALGAKLTGAGGGGSILALPPSEAGPVLETFRRQGLSPIPVSVDA